MVPIREFPDPPGIVFAEETGGVRGGFVGRSLVGFVYAKEAKGWHGGFPGIRLGALQWREKE